MLQVTQNLKSGATDVTAVPSPAASRGGLLIQSRASLVSAGTERMLVEFGRAGWIDKARSQPDKVRQVIEKIRTDGLAATLNSVQAKLDVPLPLGYSNSGVVLESGPGVTTFAPGDRVVSNGPHAEVVSVPQNLCARIPAGIPDDHAAFAVVGAIALQGLRLAGPTLGDAVVVTGLGLIGLLTVQLLRAHGCRVLGIDFDPRKLELAARFGAEVVNLARGEDPVAAAEAFSRGRGVDAVLVTAATKSSAPVHQAALMSRKRGRIVLVGVTGLELSRDDFYKKELTFQVSCSYGPGRYDPAYESGHDYPHGFVRWTAQRNFEAFLDMLAAGRLDLAPLITHRFPITRAADAYELFFSDEPYLGILLECSAVAGPARTLALSAPPPRSPRVRGESVTVGLIGAGAYASAMLLPGLAKTGARLKTVADLAGLPAAHLGRKHGFETAASDASAVLDDPEINTVFIATRHDSHAALVLHSLEAGKNVWVEKPLCLTLDELAEIEALGDAAPRLMVGFNRRFAPHIVRMRQLLATIRDPRAMVMTVNAGTIAADHWIHDPELGGGRIVGEGCHFIDLVRFLADAPIETVSSVPAPHGGATITLSFAGGSTGTVHYFTGGNKSFPKERLTVFCGGRVLELGNFIRLTGHGWPRFRKMNLWRQDKGNHAAVAAFIAAIQAGSPSPIPFSELIEVSRTAIRAR